MNSEGIYIVVMECLLAKRHCWSFIFLLCALFSYGALATTDPVEVDALKSFRYNIVDDPLGQLKDWTGKDPCGSSWNGVICEFDNNTRLQHVHELRLMNMNLTGTLAPDLGNLTRLYILNVMWNNIFGSIPPEIGNLSNLFLLLLSGNNLTGTLPDSLGNLSNLNRLQIDQNQISGPVPKIFAKLNKARHFHMNNNSLNGSIPPELGSLQSLAHLLLDNNNMTGPLPSELSNISTLLILQLDNNQFSGEIPPSYSSMYNLRKLSLRNCSLTGFIPDLAKLSKMAYLDLSRNNFSGSLPSGMLSNNFTTIDLSYNQLSGEVPSVYSDLPNLQNLVLRNNLLNGTVPVILDSGHIRNSETLKLLLDFQNNHFSSNDFINPPTNVKIRLYGNQWCDQNPNSTFCLPSDEGINTVFSTSFRKNAPSTCSESVCDPSINQEILFFRGKCICSFPLSVEYRLKSPSFAYFPPYEDSLEYYLSSVLNLLSFQVDAANYTWEIGPRLHLNLKLFPSDDKKRQFNNSELKRLYDMFTNWMIPDNATFGPYEILSFPLLYPYNVTLSAGNSSALNTGAIAGIVIGSAAITAIVVAAIMFLLMRKRLRYIGLASRRSGKNIYRERIKVAGVREFTFEEMALATNNFSSSMQVGQGGYGRVYKGKLADGQIVAIKRAQEGSLQGSKEFYTEIELLSRLHHRNLVSLIGYCDDRGEQMLVYEYMAHGTLRDHLSAQAKRPLDFRSRFQVALGSARGILYLHTEANPPIYHRDVKATNILLDEKDRAKVADFGLSRLAPVSDLEGVAPGHVSTVVKGTPGYLDPEYFLTHKLTDKSDVYSFGVVLLELITGMHPISQGKNLVREVNIAYEAGTMLSIVDSHMGSYPSEALEPLVRLAIACCKDDTDARPSMAEVVRDLEDIWRITPWSDSLNSFEASEVDLHDMRTLKLHVSNNTDISADMDGSDLMSGTIPNVVPR